MRGFFLRFPQGKEKAVTLSYDDGCRDDIRFSDVITEYGLKCTFNHTLWEHLSKEEVEKCVLSRGHELALHTASHRAPGLTRTFAGIKEMLDCRVALEKKYGIIVRGCAYPDCGIRRFENNSDYKTIKNYLTELEIAYARTLGEDNNSFALPTDFHAWMPTAHHRNPELDRYMDEFLAIDMTDELNYTRLSPKLFYLWGHSYEFEQNNEWDLLEKICKKLGGKDDIWYATNIEIYNYVQAYNSLVLSADETIIYNPTAYTVWFNVDGKNYSVASGETIKISE